MFEVELKFILTKDQEKRLLENARFIKEEHFEDIYYDDKHYYLSTNDIWLRTRNDKFLLKLPIPTTNSALKKQCNSPKLEIESHEEILKHLNISFITNNINNASNTIDSTNTVNTNTANINICKILKDAGIIPLYRFQNIRRKYKKDKFIIDLDKAIFEDFTYETCEIELVVPSEKDIEKGTEEIIEFAAKHQIKVEKVEGRLIEYIRRKNPEHYQKLMQAVC